MSKFTASFIGGGPLDGERREIEGDFATLSTTQLGTVDLEGPFEPVPVVEHVYELNPLRLVHGEDTHLFYEYIGVRK